MTLEEKAHEYAINNVCKNCNNCQSKGYIGCDTFRFAKKAYIDGHNDGADEVKSFSNTAEGYFVYDDPHESLKGDINEKNFEIYLQLD